MKGDIHALELYLRRTLVQCLMAISLTIPNIVNIVKVDDVPPIKGSSYHAHIWTVTQRIL